MKYSPNNPETCMKSFLLFAAALFCAFFATPSTGEAQWMKAVKANSSCVNTIETVETNIFIGTVNGVFVSTEGGSDWQEANNGLPNTSVNCLTVNGSNLFAGTNDGMYLSTNNGTLWVSISQASMIKSVTACVTVDGTLICATEDGFFRGNYNGKNWSWSQISSPYFTDAAVTCLAVSGSSVYAGTDEGRILMSTDKCNSWFQINTGLPPYFKVTCLAARGLTLYAGTDAGLYLYKNNDGFWSETETDLKHSGVSSVSLIGPNIFASTYLVPNGGAVYVSADDGKTWSNVSTGLTANGGITSFGWFGTDVFAGTIDRGLWQRPLPEMIVTSVQQPGVSAGLALTQNYPNPFQRNVNAATSISYTLPAAAPVRVDIYDIYGTCVKTIENTYRPAGTYTRQWDGRNEAGQAVPNGLYKCVLASNGRFSTNSVLVLN
jgi:photosystem II stability/assembly factor-like uncharacterized protein